MRDIEQKIRDIFNKRVVTDRDVAKANKLFSKWKLLSGWHEDTSNPIKAY